MLYYDFINFFILTYIIFIFDVRPIHHLQEFNLDLRLIKERLLVLDDLDGDVALFGVIECLDDLPERSFAYQRVDFVSFQELFTIFDDVIVIIVIIAFVIDFPFFLVRRVFALDLSRSSFLFRIVNLKQHMIINHKLDLIEIVIDIFFSTTVYKS